MNPRFVLSAMTAALMWPAIANASHVVWSQPWNSTFAAPESNVTTDPAQSSEAADDFEVHGTIERIVVTGNDCFQCAPPEVSGVFVRFYNWTTSGPGALVQEYFVSSTDPNFLFSDEGAAALDITLPKPFAADGRYYISVQLSIEGSGFWGWWVANNGSPSGSPMAYRTNDGEWGAYVSPLGPLNADLSFMIWGDDGNPPPSGTDPCGEWNPTPMPLPAGATHAVVRDVAAVNSSDAYAVGEYTKQVLSTYNTYTMVHHWNGSDWSLINSPSPTACSDCTWATFDAVAVAGPNDIWFAGGKRVQGPDGFLGTHIFVARYDGSNFTVMNTPLTTGASGAHVEDIVIVGENDIWFFGDYVNPQMALAMHWNGSSFTVVNTPFPAGGTPGWGLEAGAAISANDIWAVGGGSDGDYSATGYIIHWNGSAWTRMLGPTPGTNQRLWDVIAIASDDVWAVGDYFDAGSGYHPLFLHWDGSSWTQVDSPGGGRGMLAFAADNIYSSGGGIVHWDGASWEKVEDFDQVIGASTLAMASADLCNMITVGRQITVGEIMPFSAVLAPGEVGAFSTRAGDVNFDNAVNVDDLLAVINGWGNCPAPPSACPADLTGNQIVDVDDLLEVINNWD